MAINKFPFLHFDNVIMHMQIIIKTLVILNAEQRGSIHVCRNIKQSVNKLGMSVYNA